MVFTGAVPHKNLPVYYQAADLFVFASLTETQGIVILEAMASGLPVIALKDDAFREIVTDNKNGFLIDPNSSPAFFVKKRWRYWTTPRSIKIFPRLSSNR